MAAQASFCCQSLPFYGRVGTLQNAEDPVLFLKNALHASSGKHKEALKFPQMKQPHDRIYIGTWQEDASDRGRRGSVPGGSEFARGKHLLPQIRRSAKQKPNFGVGRKNNLCLRAWTCLQ